MQRQFTLLVKPPGQGRGFAGKGAKVIEVQTTFGAISMMSSRDSTKSIQGKRPTAGSSSKRST